MGKRKQHDSRIQLRLDSPLRDRLERLAQIERRPLASLCRNVLADFAAARERGVAQRNAGRLS